jgi:hypothetical protein
VNKRAQKLALLGVVEHRHEADERLRNPGQAVVVRRGVNRSLTMICPDGCGETLTINLDGRAGPAWRLYLEGKSVSLFPSVWRNTGCRSHFILWKSRIYWCDWGDPLEATDTAFQGQVLAALRSDLRPYAEIAADLNAVPWAVLSACHLLKRRGSCLEGGGDKMGWFCRAQP